MGRTATGYQNESFAYTGQKQNSGSLGAGGRFAQMNVQITGNVDTTAGTINPHPAQVANIIDLLEVYDNKNRAFSSVSGSALYYMFNWQNGVEGDNDAVAGGGIVAGDTFRQDIILPFELIDGANPTDTILQSMEKDLKYKLKYNVPTANGTMFGDATGLVLNDLQIDVSLDEYRIPADHRFNKTKPLVNGLVEDSFDYSQTDNTFKITPPKDQEYRGFMLIVEEEVNGVWSPSDALIDMTKNISIKSTKEKNTYRSVLARTWKNETLKRRGVSASVLPGGIIDLSLLRHGRINQTIVSDTLNELYIEVPVIKSANDCRVRLVSSALTTQ